MVESEKTVYLQCDCRSETVEFSYVKWADGEVNCEINIMDSYCGNNGYMGITGRFKRAWHAFWAKPICYNGVFAADVSKVRRFLEECLALVDSK